MQKFMVENDQPQQVSWFSENLGRIRDQLKFLSDVCIQFERKRDMNLYEYHKNTYKIALTEA